MTLRRLTPLKPSRGTVIPWPMRAQVLSRDGRRCVGPQIGMPRECFGRLELDHVRASGGIGLKSRSTLDNLVTLCAQHHYIKTLWGRQWRPRLLEYIASR